MQKYILITGSNGQVGSELQALSQHNQLAGFECLFLDHQLLDICDATAVNNCFEQYSIAYTINCAAYTLVDKAEEDKDNAYQINALGSENLAKACQQHGAKLLQISTDYVYHNTEQNSPFVETDATSPKGVYAVTKLQGEQMAQAACASTLVLRTSWVYSSFGNNFVKTMLRLGAERPQLNVIFDQIGSPTYAADLAAAIIEIVIQDKENKCPADAWQGVYHYSNEGVCSWFDFAVSIFDIAQLSCEVNPIETKDYPTPAKRPPFSLLNKNKLKTTFRIKIPHWRHSLNRCLTKLLA